MIIICRQKCGTHAFFGITWINKHLLLPWFLDKWLILGDDVHSSTVVVNLVEVVRCPHQIFYVKDMDRHEIYDVNINVPESSMRHRDIKHVLHCFPRTCRPLISYSWPFNYMDDQELEIRHPKKRVNFTRLQNKDSSSKFLQHWNSSSKSSHRFLSLVWFFHLFANLKLFLYCSATDRILTQCTGFRISL